MTDNHLELFVLNYTKRAAFALVMTRQVLDVAHPGLTVLTEPFEPFEGFFLSLLLATLEQLQLSLFQSRLLLLELLSHVPQLSFL